MDLVEFGINEEIVIEGTYEIISSSINESFPIVFLIDEHHGNENDCVTKNIHNAKKLILKANIVLVGVESLAGGRIWEDDEYIDNDEIDDFQIGALKNYVSKYRTFELEISKTFNNVKGVESDGMMNKIENDLINNKHKDITVHPLNSDRSKHFIITLFNYYTSCNLNGNIILNCGIDHNRHIEEWIRNGEIDNIAGFKANYIRLNAIN